MKRTSKNIFYKLPVLDGLELLDAKRHTLNFPFHTHSTFNITLVIEEIFSTKVNNRFFQAPVGKIVVTNPDEVHSTICDNKMGSSFFTFYISPDVLKSINKNKPVFFEEKIITDNFLFQQLFLISQEISKDEPAVESALLEALKRLVTHQASGIFNPGRKSSHFQKYLAEETFDKFSLEVAAQKFGLDKYKFLRLFKQETGLTPNNYIILKRIERSKELLQTQADLLDIAISTGFYDATHFCMHFKKITGVTPLTYRGL